MESVIARERSLTYIPKLLPVPKGRKPAGVYFASAKDRAKRKEWELETAKLMTRFGYDVKFTGGACWWNCKKWKLMNRMRGMGDYGRVILDTRQMGAGALQMARIVQEQINRGEVGCKEVWVLGEEYYCVVRGAEKSGGKCLH